MFYALGTAHLNLELIYVSSSPFSYLFQVCNKHYCSMRMCIERDYSMFQFKDVSFCEEFSTPIWVVT